MHDGQKVLLVDDEADVLLTMRMLLQGEGHDVAVASDGGEAIDLIERWAPAVVVLDIRMPVLDGWYVLAELGNRRNPPRVIVCTANADVRDHPRARSLGAETVLVKPYDPEELIRLVAATGAAVAGRSAGSSSLSS